MRCWTNKRARLGVRPTFDNNVMGLIPREIDGDYLFYFMRQFDMSQIANTQTLPSVRASEIAKIEIPVPTLAQQRVIAAGLKAQLADAEAARRAAMAQREGAEALVAAIYREAFVQTAPVAVPPTFDDPPPGWQWHKLTDVARLESGHTPSRARPDWWGGDVSFADRDSCPGWTMGRKHAVAHQRGGHRPFGRADPAAWNGLLLAHGLGGLRGHHGQAHGNEPGLRQLGVRRCARPGILEARADSRTQGTARPGHWRDAQDDLHADAGSFHVCAPDIDAQRRVVRDLKQRLAEVSALRAALHAQQSHLAMLPQRLLAQAFAADA